jgi:starvation-inducible DNA-binding protein
MKPDLGLDKKAVAGVTKLLGKNLADVHALYIKNRNYHWNLVGPRFHTLHVFFEEQYKELEMAIDEIAERIRTMGGVAPGSMKEFLQMARLKEATGLEIPGDEAIHSLAEDHEAIVRQLRKDIAACEETFEDAGTADFLTQLLQKHEKMAWMLRSFLDRPETR